MTLNCFAGQNEYNDLETIFGLTGPVYRVTETTISVAPIATKVLDKAITRFRRDGNRLDITRYIGKDTFKSRNIYSYDESGRRTGPKIYTNEEGNLDCWVPFIYGPDGRRIREDRWKADGTLMFCVIFDYDEKGHRTKLRWYGPDNNLIRCYRLTYDEKGNKVCTESTDSQGRLEWRQIFTYDKNSNPIAIKRQTVVVLFGFLRIRVTMPTNCVFFRYSTFDKYGNWTKALRIKMGLHRCLKFIPLPFISISKLERIIEMFD